MLCDVASIFVVRTLIVSQAYTMVLTLIDNTRIHIFMYSIPRRHFTCPFTDLLYVNKRTAIHDSNNRRFFFFFFFFYSVLRPFQDYFSSYETGQSVGGAKTGEPREKPPDTPASRTWLVSHVARAGLEPTPVTAVR